MLPNELHIYSTHKSNLRFPYSPIAVHPESVERGEKIRSKTLSWLKMKAGYIQCLSRLMTEPYTIYLLYEFSSE